jgi:hypothetical protein
MRDETQLAQQSWEEVMAQCRARAALLCHSSAALPVLVTVPVVDVRVVRMRVSERRVGVLVGVGLARIDAGGVLMLMVFVVDVPVGVRDRLVVVHVLVPLCQVKPDADAHQHGRSEEAHGYRLAEQHERERGADEGGQGEVGAGPRGADVA